MHEALSYWCMRHEAASVCGLKLLVYEPYKLLVRAHRAFEYTLYLQVKGLGFEV